MSDHVYKHIELTGTSPDSVEAAVSAAVTRAGQTMRNLRWFEVTDLRGHIEGDRVTRWQATVKIGFTLEE